MKSLLALMGKDLRLEFRRRETLASMIVLGLLLAVVTAVGTSSAFIDQKSTEKMFPTLVWVIFLFSATVSIGRSQEYELENSAFEGLLLSGVSPSYIFLSKALCNFMVNCLGHASAITLLAILLGVSLTDIVGGFTLLSILVLFAYSTVATLLSGISSTSRLKGLILPLILLPILFPLFFCALELSSSLLDQRQLLFDTFWFRLLLTLNLVYFLAGINLYEFVIRE